MLIFSSRRVSASGLCEWYIKFELIVNDVSWAIFQRKWLLLLGNAVAEYAWYSFDGNKIWTWMNMNRICSKSPRQRSYENGKDYKSFDSGSRLQISNRLRRLSEDGKCSALNWAGVAFSSRRVSASGLCEWYIKFELIVNDVSWAIFQWKWLLLFGNTVAEYAWYSFDGNKIWTWMNMNRICSKSPSGDSARTG